MKIMLLAIPWSYYELRNLGPERPTWLKPSWDVSGQGVLPPYGLLQLASVLREAGHEVCFFDGYLKTDSEIVEYALKENPEMLGVSTPTCLWEKTKLILKKLRKELPRTFFLLGGSHSTFAKEACLREAPELDAAVVGEGDLVVQEIASRISLDQDLEGIDGLIFRRGKEVVKSPSVCYVRNLNELPLPAYDLINFQSYIPNLVFLHKAPFAHIVTARGCSQNCSFCFYGRNTPVRFKNIDYLMEEIEYLVKRHGVKTINFYDDNNIFAFDEERAYVLCKRLRQMKKRPSWSIYLVNFDIGEEVLKEMKQSGCFRIHCAVESGTQKNRDRICGHHFSIKKIAEKIRQIRKIGISTCGRFQFGIPGETFVEGLEAIDFACHLSLDYAFFVRAFLFPGSQMFETYRSMGRVDPDTRKWNSYVRFYRPDSMEQKDVERLIKLGYARFYRRPSWWIVKFMRFWEYGFYLRYFRRVLVNQVI